MNRILRDPYRSW